MGKINTTGHFLFLFIQKHEEHGLQAFADATKTSYDYLHNFIRGNEPLDREVIVKACYAYDLDWRDEEIFRRQVGKTHTEPTCSVCGVPLTDSIGDQEL